MGLKVGERLADGRWQIGALVGLAFTGGAESLGLWSCRVASTRGGGRPGRLFPVLTLQRLVAYEGHQRPGMERLEAGRLPNHWNLDSCRFPRLQANVFNFSREQTSMGFMLCEGFAGPVLA